MKLQFLYLNSVWHRVCLGALLGGFIGVGLCYYALYFQLPRKVFFTIDVGDKIPAETVKAIYRQAELEARRMSGDDVPMKIMIYGFVFLPLTIVTGIIICGFCWPHERDKSSCGMTSALTVSAPLPAAHH